jgi:hypothetical protein
VPRVRHKVFVSFYHEDDDKYRRKWDETTAEIFINKSVGKGEIDSDNSDDYIKRLIREQYLDDASVLVVLVGPNTRDRKHVDWEISAALNKKVGGYSGLMGLLLPTHPDYRKKTYTPELLPPRLADNAATGYAHIYDWTTDLDILYKHVHAAFLRRDSDAKLIDNSRPQFKRNH